MKRRIKMMCLMGLILFVMVACSSGTRTEPVKEEKKEVMEQVTEEPQSDDSVSEKVEEEENRVEETEQKENDKKEPAITEPETEETEFAGDENSYEAVLAKYRRALEEKWDPGRLMSEDISILLSYCYEGSPLHNVGFCLLDMDGNGTEELLLGEIAGDEFVDGMLFDVYSLADETLIHLVSGSERDRYYLMEEEAGGYHIANEASAGAGHSGWFYANLMHNELNIHQAIIYDQSETGAAWYMMYEKGWDVSEAKVIEEDLARAIIDSNEKHYVEVAYTPFEANTEETVDYSLEMSQWVYRTEASDDRGKALNDIAGSRYGVSGASLSQLLAALGVYTLTEQEMTEEYLEDYLGAMNATQRDFFSFQWQMSVKKAKKMLEEPEKYLGELQDVGREDWNLTDYCLEEVERIDQAVQSSLTELGVENVWKEHLDQEPFYEWTE